MFFYLYKEIVEGTRAYAESNSYGEDFMEDGRIVRCILSAIIGAGFASGREIMHFFSGYGVFSWVLIAVSTIVLTGLIVCVMRQESILSFLPRGKMAWIGEGIFLGLLACTSGGMTAAAGELAALILPVHHARGIGLIVTLTGCLFISRRPLGLLEKMGRLLLPLIVLAFLLCLRQKNDMQVMTRVTFLQGIRGFFQAISYAGFNVALAAEVLCEAGERCNHRGICRGAAWAGGSICALLMLGNAALLPWAEALSDEPLPIVVMLREYGKTGYYLAAVSLYLAVVTTLIAVLRSLSVLIQKHCPRYGEWIAWFFTGIIAHMGFDRIVETAYPALGFLCVFLFAFSCKRKRKETRSFRLD